MQQKIYKLLIYYSFILISCLFTGFVISCKNNCPSNADEFKFKMKGLVENVNKIKRLKTDNDWDLIDKKVRNTVFECHPKIASQLSPSEEIYFWENILGYVYVRYGADLLKKYGNSDRLMLRIRDQINSKKIGIKPAVKRLCKEWPVLYGTSDEAIEDQLQKVFEPVKKDKILLDSLIN